MITPEQLERPGYDTRDTLKDQRFANYFGGDPSGPSNDGVTPTDRASFVPSEPTLFDLFSSRTDFGSESPGQRTGFGRSNALSAIDTDLERMYSEKFPMANYLSGRGNNEAEAQRYWLAGITDPRATEFLGDQTMPKELRQWYFENPDVLGQYVTRWGPGDVQEGGTFQYNPYEFAAAAGMPGLDPKMGTRFQQQQSAEAQASRDVDEFGLGSIGSILGLASMFIPGLQPIAMGLNAVNAIQSGNPLGIIGSLSGLFGGPAVIGKGIGAINAVRSGNPISMLQSGLGLANSFNNTSGGNNIALDDYWSGDTGQGGTNWADFTSTPSGQADWDFLQGGNFGTDVYGAGGNPLSDFGQWGTGSNPYGGFDDWGTGSGGANPSAGGFNLDSIFNSGTLNKGLDFLNKNMNTIGGLAGIYQKYQQGQQMKNLTNQMMGGFDPFGSQRPQYQAQLAQTYTNPALYLNSPEYKAIEGRLRRELERKDAAGGRRSQYGNRALELQDAALANLFKQRGQLGEFAGAGIAPSADVGQAAQKALAASQKNSGNILGDIARIFGDRQKEKQPLLDLSMF